MNDDDDEKPYGPTFGWVFVFLFALIGATAIPFFMQGAITLAKWALGL